MRILAANSNRLLLTSLKATELLGVDGSLPSRQTKLFYFFGNSHLRQIGRSLICQYWPQAQDAIQVDKNTYTVHFHNNVTIHVITNNPFVYSEKWVDLLESRLMK
jgi:hypothetical protein